MPGRKLVQAISATSAAALILLGDVIDAAEALRLGLANRVVAGEDLDATPAELAGRLAAEPPLAVRGARRAIDAAWHRSPEESFRAALDEQIRCIESDDFKEAIQAMAEGRKPKWQGVRRAVT
jgi:enoyl-CoA hydratase/carnithine racemase